MDTCLFLRPSYCFDSCWFSHHPLAPFFQSTCVLLVTSAHLLLVVASREHSNRYQENLFLNTWAQTSGPEVSRYQVQCLCHWGTELHQPQSPDDDESPEGRRGWDKVQVRSPRKRKTEVSDWGEECVGVIVTKWPRTLRRDSLSGGDRGDGKFLLVREFPMCSLPW